MKNKGEVQHEELPELRWPDGQSRTRIQDRLGRSAWKQPLRKSIIALQKELERCGATSSLLTYSSDPREPGAAIHFSRQAPDQYGWQEALGLIGIVPTLKQIDEAYRAKALKCHPDRPGGDADLFAALAKHRDRAYDWVQGKHKTDHEYVMAIDSFNETRLNITALRIVFYSMRRIEDCGAPLMMERAFSGFHKQITTGATEVA